MSMSTTSDDHTAEIYYSDEAFYRGVQRFRVSAYDQHVYIVPNIQPKIEPTNPPQANQDTSATEKDGGKKQ